MKTAANHQPDKRAAIAQALLDGAAPHEIEARLVAAGFSPAAARYEAERALKDPLVDAALRLRNRLEKRDWTLDIYRKLAALDADSSIATVDAIEPARFYREYYCTNRPVKLTGLVGDWPALGRWTLDYLEAKVGDAVVELQAQRGTAQDYEIAKDRHKRHARMTDVIGLLRDGHQGNDFYVTAYNDTTNKQTLAPLWDDLGPISILRPSGGRDGFFWMGPKGTVTPFHHDLTNNLLVQVAGRKLVRMVPSYEVARMRNALHCFSDWSAEALDALAGDPKAPRVLSCEIGPGEAIFLPIGWWHHVVGLDMTISLSFTNFAADNDFYSDYLADPRF